MSQGKSIQAEGMASTGALRPLRAGVLEDETGLPCGLSARTCNRLMLDFGRCGVASPSFHAFLPAFQTRLSWGIKINLQICSRFYNHS